MKAIEILMEEHRLIERVLAALERATTRLSRGEEVYLRFFTGAAYFNKAYTDGCHNRKEENILFPALVEAGSDGEAGPVAAMIADHAEGRHLAQTMRQMTERFQGGDARARGQVVQSASRYIELLQGHIYKEDNILFPLADKLIPTDQLQHMGEAFSQVEYDESGEELHEKYRGLVERLEKECLRSA